MTTAPIGFKVEAFDNRYNVDEIGGMYRGWFVRDYRAAVHLAGVYAIQAGIASDILAGRN